MEILQKVLLILHIASGFSSLAMGLVIVFFFGKGTSVHKKMGMVYFIGMIGVFISAMLLMVLFKFQTFLFAMAVFSFYLAYGGFRSIRLKKTAQPKMVDWVAAVLAILTGTGIFGYGWWIFFKVGGFHILGMLCLIFGFFTVFTAYGDIKGKNKKEKEPLWWWYQHVQGMAGSLIAATTAFAVTSLTFVIPGTSLDWILWLLPTAIGAPMIAVTVRRMKAQAASTKA